MTDPGWTHGVTAALRRHRADIITVAVEPAESPILSEGRTGAHEIEGIGIGFAPPMWDPADATELMTVTTHAAEEMARRLARDEALFAGASSGANVAAALRLAERLGPAATVVTLLVDSGLKYLTTAIYRDAERGALADTRPLMSPATDVASDTPAVLIIAAPPTAFAGPRHHVLRLGSRTRTPT